jgi:hypothetical protein
MGLQLRNTQDIKWDTPALVVCAGTVTCSTVSGMGSGFLLFKKLFSNNIYVNNPNIGWEKVLKAILDKFQKTKKLSDMPAYVRMAEHKSLIGGIATVPVYDKNSIADNEKRYKEAVKQAVLDAVILNTKLIIQPLGIGVYGWPPECAAQLFLEAVNEVDPTGDVEIIISIYDKSPGKPDQLFKEALTRPPAQSQEHLVSASPKPSETTNNVSPHEKLNKIIDILVMNIENKQGDRLSSGKNSSKVESLKALKKTMTTQTIEETIAGIRAECSKKRNSIHFWHTPDSVYELEHLLIEHHLNIKTQSAEKNPKNK